MTRIYDTLQEFGLKSDATSENETPDCISTSPGAIVAVWRYRFPVTFSRQSSTSFSGDIKKAMELRDEPLLLIYEDIVSLTVSQTKNSHIGQLQMTLKPGANYIAEIFPGDWVGCWMVNQENEIPELVRRIKAGEKCNGFDEGLKFLGKIGGTRKIINQTPTGTRTVIYTVTATSFSEFDNSIYYEPYLAANAVGISTAFFQRTGRAINEIIKKKEGLIDINKVFPFYMSVFFGTGVPKNQGFSDPTLSLTQGLDNKDSLLVPNEIAGLLGISSGSKAAKDSIGWNDVCNVLQGVQKYDMGASSETGIWRSSEVKGEAKDKRFSSVFLPTLKKEPWVIGQDERVLVCSDDMLGSFVPQVEQFSGQRSVWSVLQQYLNPTVNEMYTCLRMGPTGIMPTLVVRQIPFSTGLISEEYKLPRVEFADKKDKKGKPLPKTQDIRELTKALNRTRDLAITRFAELPRWLIHPILIRKVDFGRSDALRFNFVHVYAEIGTNNGKRTGSIVRDPPIADPLDIARSGLRPFMATVNCSEKDANDRRAGDWMYLVSDRIMGQHLVLTGSAEIVGIQAPICPGDNIEYDEHIFHIESVVHSFSIQNGTKKFSTMLALTNGLKRDQMSDSNLALYSGVDAKDMTTFEPGITTEYTINEERPASVPESEFFMRNGEEVD